MHEDGFIMRDPLIFASAFESTLSGMSYAKRIVNWKRRGYVIEIVYIRLASPRLALSRIAARVRQGGHDVPRSDVLRRFKRGWVNFLDVYRPFGRSLGYIREF
jgi:predicted ABC-type ATPase